MSYPKDWDQRRDGVRAHHKATALETCQTWPRPTAKRPAVTMHPSKALRLRRSKRGTTKTPNPPIAGV